MFANRNISEAFDLLLRRVLRTQQEAAGGFPIYSDDSGKWHYQNGWTAPFWVGMNWLAYAYTQDNRYRDYGLEMFGKLDPYPSRFQYFIAGVLGYEVTGEKELYRQSCRAAEFLKGMYIPAIQQIPAFPGENDVIVDVLPSLAILWWYARQTGDEEAAEVALSHWEKSAEDFIRSDGATYQSIHYDLSTGKVVKRHCHHDAARDEACASQTHAWAVSGYAYAYQARPAASFLDAGRKVVDYALANLPSDSVPFHNFGPHEDFRDTSAAAIIASALLDWARLDPDADRRAKYRKAAAKMVASLANYYLTPTSPDDARPPGMLLEGCYNYQGDVPCNELIWGSYFLLEALYKMLSGHTCLLQFVSSQDIPK